MAMEIENPFISNAFGRFSAGFESPLSHQKKLIPKWVSAFFDIKGTRTIKCNSPVDCCHPAARRRMLLRVTSPLSRTKKGGLIGLPFELFVNIFRKLHVGVQLFSVLKLWIEGFFPYYNIWRFL